MNSNHIQIAKWSQKTTPTEAALRQRLEDEGFTPRRWANEPGFVYDAHQHEYHKVIVVVHGSIVFGFPVDGQPTVLQAGDRLDLPARVRHNAVVGPDGVVCLEAHVDSS